MEFLWSRSITSESTLSSKLLYSHLQLMHKVAHLFHHSMTLFLFIDYTRSLSTARLLGLTKSEANPHFLIWSACFIAGFATFVHFQKTGSPFIPILIQDECGRPNDEACHLGWWVRVSLTFFETYVWEIRFLWTHVNTSKDNPQRLDCLSVHKTEH